MLNQLPLDRRGVLLIDAVGAAVTAFATIYLLAGERLKTGLPTDLLFGMGVIAACFALFDVVAIQLRIDPSISLRMIACANLTYCSLTAASLFVHRASVTSLGVAYFFIEVVVVAALAIWEWRLAARPIDL